MGAFRGGDLHGHDVLVRAVGWWTSGENGVCLSSAGRRKAGCKHNPEVFWLARLQN